MRCEIPISPCATSPCMNSGTCIDSNDGSFVCECAPGFTGTLCDIDLDVCQTDTCLNGGTCVEGYGNSFTCECPPEFTGPQCGTQVVFCFEDTCLNGGTCNELPDGFVCTCSSGFTGTNCEVDIDECNMQSPPCQNGATCMNLFGSYACVCSPGFTGPNCADIIDFCNNISCSGNGNCSSLSDRFVCECNPGYTGQECDIDINECEESPCSNGANCTDGINMFLCICQPGFTGDLCATDIDECAPSPCGPGATCSEGIAEFNCSCPPGFSGELCDIQDFCFDDPCYNGNCTSTDSGFICSCFAGWSGDQCQYANSVAVKLDFCGLPAACDILAVEELATENQPVAFTSETAPVSKRYEISDSTDGIFWSGWVWQDYDTTATLFSLSDENIASELELVSDLPNQQLILYYTSIDSFGPPVSVTFSNAPLSGNEWHHISIAIFNSGEIIVAIDTAYTQQQTVDIGLEATFEFSIPLVFSLTLGRSATLIVQDITTSPFTGIMQAAAIVGIQEEATFNITNIESCLLNCLGDQGFCGSYGQCLDQFRLDRLCNCNDGATGLQCNYRHTRFEFSGNGYVLSTATSVAQNVEFKPNSLDGHILVQTDLTTEVSIELSSGTVTYSVEPCGSPPQSALLGSVERDLQWHSVSISDSVQLDALQAVPPPETTQASCNYTNHGQIILGLLFQGCVREVEIDDQLIDSSSVMLQGDARFGCTHDTAQFFTVSYLELPEFISRESQVISLYFNTLSDNGTLYFSNRMPSDATGNSTSDFVALSIVSGQVTFSFNLGELGQDTAVESPQAVSDGRWHHVVAVQNMTMASLTVDSVTVTAASTGPLRLLDTTGNVYLGGVPALSNRFQRFSEAGFNGCLRDVEQNGVAVDLRANMASQNVHFGTCN